MAYLGSVDMTTSSISFSRWAVYAHKDDTGFGRQAVDIREILGLRYHLVIPSERLYDHPIDGITERLLPSDAPLAVVRNLISELEGIIFFERPNWHPEILRSARELGVFTVCVPNWEWFDGVQDTWKYCDFLACPTRWTERLIRSYGFSNAGYVPWPINLARFAPAYVQGPARHFIHNAGLVDPDDRKGTRDAIQAFCRLKRRDVKLTVRLQRQAPLPPMDDRVEVVIGNLANPADLYASGDICVQPSKMEGIGFMVLEPACAGMPVITTDYPPMNEFIHQPEMRCRTRWRKRRAFPTSWIPHAHLKLPSISDLTRKMEWAASNDLAPISQCNRAWAERTFDPIILRRSWELLLSQIPRHVGTFDQTAASI